MPSFSIERAQARSATVQCLTGSGEEQNTYPTLLRFAFDEERKRASNHSNGTELVADIHTWRLISQESTHIPFRAQPQWLQLEPRLARLPPLIRQEFLHVEVSLPLQYVVDRSRQFAG